MGGVSTYRVWCIDAGYCNSSPSPDASPDAYGVKSRIEEIERGNNAVLIMDFTNPLKRKDFGKDLGRHLVDFAGGGGVIAFPLSEACRSGY